MSGHAKKRALVLAMNIAASDPGLDERTTPECRLWLAVIEKCIVDFRELFAKITRQIGRTGTYNAHYLYEYRTFKHEIEHQAFKDACDFASFPHDKVLNLFTREAKASGLFDVEPRVPKFSSNIVKRLRGWH